MIPTSQMDSGTNSERRGLPDNIHAHTESTGAVIEQDVAVLLPAPLQASTHPQRPHRMDGR